MPQVDVIRVGVDLGGTWIRIGVFSGTVRPLHSLKAPAPSLTDLPEYLKHQFRRWKVRPSVLTIASRGLWSGPERQHLSHKLQSLASQVRVLSDVEGAWLAAFSASAEGGILIIAGTGSIVYGRDKEGCARRAGGLGPFLGDEGSAFWIGREWLRHMAQQPGQLPSVLKLLHTPDFPARKIAALCPSVMAHARRGNGQAHTIIHQAQQHLAELVITITRTLHWKETLPVSVAGSVLENAWFQTGFKRSLTRVTKNTGHRVAWVQRQHDVVKAIL